MIAGALALVAVGCGVLGVQQQLGQHSGTRHDVWEVCFRVLQLFVLEWDEPGAALPLPWPLQVARFLAPAVTAYAAVEAGRRLFADELRQRRARRRRGHAIVCGAGPGARSLARALVGSGRRVVLVGGEAAGRAAGASGGAAAIAGDARFPATLASAGLQGASELYACDEDSTRNLAVALTAAGTGSSDGLRIHAEIGDPVLCRALQARWWSGSEVRRVRLDFFNRYEAAAGRLVQEESASGADGVRREVVIVGDGAFARSLTLAWARAGRSGDRPAITLVGPGAEQAARELMAQFPFLADACTLRNLSADAGKAVRRAAGRGAAARVYLCVPDQEQVIRQALTDTDLWRAGPETVTVCVDDVIGYGEAFQRTGDADAPLDGMGGRLKLWGIKTAAYRPDAVGEDLTEVISRAVHAAYLRERERDRAAGAEPRGTVANWEDLTEDLRNANRAQVLSYGQKLAELGCVLVPRDGRTVPFAAGDADVERLAKAEHLRWTADRQRAGWTYAAVRDDALLHHPDLVPWDQLPEEDREKDREAVRGMGAVLADAGFDVVRVAGAGRGAGIPAPRS
ncbi:RyR domain-containing protein [Streptomyces sp. NPDC055134]